MTSLLSSSLPFLLLACHLAEAANNNTSTSSDNANDNSSSPSSSFNPTVFWTVNAFILCLLLAACCSCRYGGKYLGVIIQNMTRHDHHARQNSDLAFIRHQLAREAARAAAKQESPEIRKKRVLDSFRRCGVTMVVKPEDILDSLDDSGPERPPSSGGSRDVNSHNIGTAAETEADENVIVVETAGTTDTDANDAEEDGCDAGYLVLRSAKTQTQQQPRKVVPNGCAICLDPYDVGEVVVWSSNVACKHAFHQECMVDWLCKMQDSTPCPFCRQEFTDLETYNLKKKKIVQTPRDTFNPQLVHL